MGSLRRFDVQAAYSLVLSLISIPPLIAAVIAVISRYNADLGQIIYGAKGRFLLAFLGAVGVSSALGALGFFLGWNSAGQRRNERQSRSWIGFFVGGAVLTGNVILLIAFCMLRFQQPI